MRKISAAAEAEKEEVVHSTALPMKLARPPLWRLAATGERSILSPDAVIAAAYNCERPRLESARHAYG